MGDSKFANSAAENQMTTILSNFRACIPEYSVRDKRRGRAGRHFATLLGMFQNPIIVIYRPIDLDTVVIPSKDECSRRTSHLI